MIDRQDSSMRMKSASWVETTLVAACLVAVAFPIPTAHGETIIDLGRSIFDTDVFAKPEQSLYAEDLLHDRVDEGKAETGEEHLDLLTACTDPAREKLSEACLKALDRFFLNKAFGYQSPHYPIHYENLTHTTLYYGRIFAEPVADRSRVLSVLDREECFLTGDDRLEYWGRSGRNLKESCHAAAFTNHAQFGAICSGYRGGRDAEREWIDPEWAVYAGKTRFQHFVNVMEEFRKSGDDDAAFERRKNWLWVEVLEARWLKRQCAKSDSVHTLDGDRYVLEFERLKTLATRLQHVPMSIWEARDPRINIYEGLTRLASFLGERLTEQGFREGDEAWQELVYGERLEDTDWARNLDKNFLCPTNSRGIRMLVGTSIATVLESRGVDFDWHWLVESVCRTSDYRGTDDAGSKSCRWWVDNVRADIMNGEFHFLFDEDMASYTRNEESLREHLWVFDRFEEVALELGVYD